MKCKSQSHHTTNILHITSLPVPRLCWSLDTADSRRWMLWITMNNVWDRSCSPRLVWRHAGAGHGAACGGRGESGPRTPYPSPQSDYIYKPCQFLFILPSFRSRIIMNFTSRTHHWVKAESFLSQMAQILLSLWVPKNPTCITYSDNFQMWCQVTQILSDVRK